MAACVFLCSAGILNAAGPGDGQVRLDWDAVRGAQGYVVEIKDAEGKIIFKKNAEKNFVMAPLVPGNYRIRISALNVFMKPASSSGWTDLIVRKKTENADELAGESESLTGRQIPEKDAPEGEEAREDEDALKKEEALKREDEARKRAEEARKREEEEERAREAARKKEERLRARTADSSRGMLGLGPLEIALGASCQFPVGEWERYLDMAPAGHVGIAYGLAGIPAVRSIPVLSSFGFALKFGVIPFNGRSAAKAKMSLLNMTPTAGIFYDFRIAAAGRWSFHIRPNFLVGPSFTILDVRGIFPRKKRATNFSYDAQVLFRAAFDGKFFMDAGFGYMSVLYSGQALHSICPFVQVGILL
ncbi:MAG: hypothetical protein JXA07_01710 [Spirochaetes bacterium]|nr:hypothetical protein [Spirochaetota bacterium]